MGDDLSQLDVFYGELTANRAYVYARLPRPTDDAGLLLAGEVRGPRCLYAESLPFTYPLVDCGTGPTALARALIPDPCFWSPDLPAIYDVTVRLHRGTDVVASARREIGLRWLGIRGTHLALEGKRWVLRGVLANSTLATLPRQWHEASAAFVVSHANHPQLDAQLAEASQFGALAVVEIPRGDAGARDFRQMAQHPAAAVAVEHRSLPPEFRRSAVAPNLLLAQRIGPGDPLVRQPWADLFLAETTDAERLHQIAALAEVPIVIVRPLSHPLPLDQARAECDALQRELAPVGQFAGYIV